MIRLSSASGAGLVFALLLPILLPVAAPDLPVRAEEEPPAVFCPVCGARNNPGSRFCARDGTPLPEILPGRYQVNFVRAPETYSAEEVRISIDRAAESVVRILVKRSADLRYPVLSGYGGGKMEVLKGERSGAGSGFASGRPGEIVTNAHVASPFGAAAILTVEARDGRSFPARVVGIDRASDLALLQIESDTIPPLPWGDSDQVNIGDETWAVGNPLDIGISVTRGTISSIARLHAGLNQIENLLHSDASITSGNSGGPLLDVLGRVVGVSDMGFLQTTGQGYSIPSNMARLVIDRLREFGKYERGFLGIQGRPVDERSIEKYGIKRTTGLVVESVLPNSPADRAGFQPGDVLFGINGRRAATSYLLQEAVSSLGPGASVKIAVDRSGQPMEIAAVTVLRPDEPRVDPLADLEKHLLAQFETDPSGKVVLRIRDRFSVAPRYGFRDGDVIQSVLPAQDWPETTITFKNYRLDLRPTPVKSLKDLRKALGRAYVGGRLAATFVLKPDKKTVYSVVFDEEWPIIL